MSKYEDLYNRVGSQIGWDFSSLQTIQERVKWDLYDLVIKRSKSHSFLLDLGTGGGHNMLEVASQFSLAIGIDSSAAMIATAQKNLKKTGLTQTKFLQMANEAVQFPDSFFDIISARHTPFAANEVFRLLRPGGLFLCQDVTEADKLNIKQTFNRGQSYGIEDGVLLANNVKELEQAGFDDIQTDTYSAVEYYQRPEDLMFLLQNTPIIIDFGEQENDMECFARFVEMYQTKKGIKTNASRSLLVAKKS